MFKKVTYLSTSKKPTTKEKVKAIEILRETYSLKQLLRASRVPKTTYHYQIKHKDDQKDKDKTLIELIKSIRKANYDDYSYQRITLKLKALGYQINHKKVYRTMKENNLMKPRKKKGYKSQRGEVGKIAENHLNQKFTTTKPYEKLGTDVTQFTTSQGKLYLSPVIDFHSREILAYDLSRTPNFNQIKRMVNDLVTNHQKHLEGSILHSDQGWQYQMKWYHLELKKQGMIQSMNRKGNCYDNSPTENFFGRLKVEMYHHKNFESLEHLESEIHKYIEYYNKERIVARLKMSPHTYRTRFFNQKDI